MRIGINASCLEAPMFGVGRFLANLLDEWAQQFPSHTYHLFFRRKVPTQEVFANDCLAPEIVTCPRWLDKMPVWEQILLPGKLLGGEPLDLFFSPSYILPGWRLSKKAVVQIFDISYLSHPEWYSAGERLYYRLATWLTVRRADLIVTGSHFSRNEIVRHLGVNPDRIRVVYPAVEKRFQIATGDNVSSEVRRKFEINAPYILYVGLVTQRRNISTLLHAFARYCRTGQEHHLVIVGANRTHPYFNVQQAIQRLGIQVKTRYLGHIGEEDLIGLYQGADCFVYPSAYEGFGIPPLEAMACGVPVITSGLSSLPEVVGNAAFLLNDPSDVEELSAALGCVLSNSRLREQMVSAGQERARQFSWARSALEMMSIFEEVMQLGKHSIRVA